MVRVIKKYGLDRNLSDQEKPAAITMAAKAAVKAVASATKSAATAAAEFQYPWREKLSRYKDELAKGVWGYWELGAWKPLALSARRRARLRKEVLLAGQYGFSPLNVLQLFFLFLMLYRLFFFCFIWGFCVAGIGRMIRRGRK